MPGTVPTMIIVSTRTREGSIQEGYKGVVSLSVVTKI